MVPNALTKEERTLRLTKVIPYQGYIMYPLLPSLNIAIRTIIIIAV